MMSCSFVLSLRLRTKMREVAKAIITTARMRGIRASIISMDLRLIFFMIVRS